VRISHDLNLFPYRAVITHTFFLGVMLRVELETPAGVVIRARMTKEEYAQLGLHDGMTVSFGIRSYRILGSEGEPMSAELIAAHAAVATFGEGI